MFRRYRDLHARRCPVHFRSNWNIDHSGKNTFMKINVDMSIGISGNFFQRHQNMDDYNMGKGNNFLQLQSNVSLLAFLYCEKFAKILMVMITWSSCRMECRAFRMHSQHAV